MTLNFSATITIIAEDKTKAIYDSINVDNEFYPENPVKTEIKFDKKIVVSVKSEQLSHIRANLNSTLRLVQTSYDSMESVKIQPSKKP